MMLQSVFNFGASSSSAAVCRGLGIASLVLAIIACSDRGARHNLIVAGGSAPARQPTLSGADGSTAAGRGGTVAMSTGSGSAGRGGSQGPMSNAGRASPTSAEDADAGMGRDAAESDARDSGAGDASAPPALTCPSTALAPGETRAMLTHAERMREYLMYVPRSYDNRQPVALVLNFHGNTMTATQQRDLSRMNALADAKGFVVVYPQGIGNSWNAGACCGEAQNSKIDDVGFTRALVKAVQGRVCIDPRRIYAAGFSNGGRMSYRLGCEMADVFAALAPVAGTKSFPDLENSPGCKPTHPISLIDFMGSADSRVAAQPGQIAEWVAFNGCTDASPMETHRQGEHVCSTYSRCKAGTSVTYCVVAGGGHCWPGNSCPFGTTSRAEELSANDLLWKLFERSMR